MKIAWLFSEQLSKTAKLDESAIKENAPTWGSCNILGQFPIDNIVCNNIKTVKALVDRNVQKQTNLFVPHKYIAQLGNPPNLKGFQGEFKDTNINNKDDIIGLNIVANMYDIILLVGFKFAKSTSKDKLVQHRQFAYIHNVQTIIKENPDKQFVLVNQKGKLNAEFEALENLTRDSLSNVLELISEIT